MLRFYERLTPRFSFWLGFACCPLLTWSSFAVFVILVAQTHRHWWSIPPNLSSFVTGLLVVTGLIFLAATPLFAGFATALFWRHFKSVHGDNEMAGFWSITITWIPALVCLLIFNPWIFPFLLFPFMIFTLLYVSGMRRGLLFWNSNSSRQWFGDFSDMERRQEP